MSSAAGLPYHHTRAIDRLEETLDPILQQRLRRWDERPLAPLRPSLPQSFREVVLHLVPRDWYAGYLGVRDELEVPWELRRDLRERVPQAMLRDVHRLEYRERAVGREPVDLGLDQGGAA